MVQNMQKFREKTSYFLDFKIHFVFEIEKQFPFEFVIKLVEYYLTFVLIFEVVFEVCI